MKIKQLKEAIANLPDDMEVMAEGEDHSFVNVYTAQVVRAEFSKKYDWYFESDEGATTPRQSPYNTFVDIFYIK